MGFKDNLRAELAYSGMLIKELSNLSGINTNTLNNYLNKRGQMPSIEAGVKLARALGVTVEYLVLGEESEKTDSEVNGELRSIIRLFKNLGQKERRLILEMLKWLNKRTDLEL